MRATSLAGTVLLCLLAAPMASAQPPASGASPSAGARLQPAAKPAPAWPKTLTAGVEAADAKAPAPRREFSPQEIEAARERCASLLKGLAVVVEPIAPIQEGSACGNPAPMRLISIGANPQIAVSPPATVTCDLVAALHKWLDRDLQALARKHLGSPLIRVETMSSYSCRNAYGRAKNRLSEHGRANALDIGGFVTAKAQLASVAADWGPTAREIAAQVAAAKAAAEQAAASAAAPETTIETIQPVDQASPLLRPGFGFSLHGSAASFPGWTPNPSPALGLDQPSRLGGPKPANASVPAAAGAEKGQADPKAAFLHAAHRAACKIFGTVLGPEANDAHKNHFHVDMAVRQHTSICE